MKRILALLVLWLPLQWAEAQAPDVGLLNEVAGEITYVGEGGAPNKAQTFMRVRQGDRFVLAAGTRLRLIYFEGGRQETWKGPATFRSGARQSEPASGAGPEVMQLPDVVPQKIARMPELMRLARLGGMTVRGQAPRQHLSPQQQEEVSRARETYRKLRAQSPADDITPELFLLSVLQEFQLYDEMKGMVVEMRRRQPANPDLGILADWLAGQASQ